MCGQTSHVTEAVSTIKQMNVVLTVTQKPGAHQTQEGKRQTNTIDND